MLKGLFYFHILLDDHHVIDANGLAAESLHVGKESLLSMSREARTELDQIFPGLSCSSHYLPTKLCPSSFAGRRVRTMAQRYEKNQRDLTVPF